MLKNTKEKDPVCGKEVSRKAALYDVSFNNKTFLFCSRYCLEKFNLNPEKYLSSQNFVQVSPKYLKDPQKYSPKAIENIYVDEKNSEYIPTLKRFIICTIFAIPLVFFNLGGRTLFGNLNINEFIKWTEIILTTFIFLWGSLPLLKSFCKSISEFNMNMFTLIALGISTIYSYSLTAALFPTMFPASFINPATNEIDVYFASTSIMIVLILLGQVLELKARKQGIVQRTKAPIQKLVETVSVFFVIAVMLIAIFTIFLWVFIAQNPKTPQAIANAIAVLMIASPWALSLATLMPMMIAAKCAATGDVLFKNSEAIEKFKKTNTLVLDKTGTLTIGKPKLVFVKRAGKYSEDEILTFAASVEKMSDHPLAAAIIFAAKEKNIEFDDILEFASITGKGVSAKIADKNIAVGNQKLMQDLSVDYKEHENKINALQEDGHTVILVAIDNEFSGFFGFLDPLKESTILTIQGLKNIGINLVLITGDSEKTALAIAKKVHIKNVYANATPQKKADIIKDLKNAGNFIALTGCSTHDSLALAQAHVRITLNTTTEIAINSTDLRIKKGELSGILHAKLLSEASFKNIKQNLIFVFIYNVLSIPVAAGLLYPFFGLLLNPAVATAAMVISSMLVILNALRLKKIQI